jgi:hypothetical protein
MKVVIPLLTFAYLVRFEFETRVRFFFIQKRKKKKIPGPELNTTVSRLI